MPLLEGLPAFSSGSESLLVLSPHPDDETLSVGGLIAAQRESGMRVQLVAVTDGENAYTDNEGLAERRIVEQTDAAERLGIRQDDIVRLRLTDSGVTAQQATLFHRLAELLSPQTHLLAPWPGDFHPDHEACGRVAQALGRHFGCRLTFYLFWTWHRGTPDLLKGLRLEAFELSESQRAAKHEALSMHRSQLEHPSGDPILHPIHLWPAAMPFEVYLPA